jgi:hypothetical protein
VPVEVKTPPAIVPFQMPTFRIALPAVRVALGMSVVIVKTQLPVGKPVPPAVSSVQPVPVGVAGGEATAVVFAAPGIQR